MNTRSGLATSLLAIAAATPLAAATAPQDNGALLYWQAITILDLPEDNPLEVHGFGGDALGEPGWSLPHDVAEALQDIESPLNLLEEAAAKPFCDFGTQLEKGPGALLPHLAGIRKAQRFVLMSARTHLDAGDTEEFTQRIEAAWGMSEDIANGNTVIDALVSAAMFAASEPLVTYALKSDLISDRERSRLFAALEQFEGDDPFFIRGSITRESDVMSQWMRDELFDPATIAELVAASASESTDDLSPQAKETFEILQMMFNEEIPTLFVEIADLDIQKEIELYEQFMHESAKAFDNREGDLRLNELEAQLEDGKFGLISRLMAPALSRLHQNFWKSFDNFNRMKELSRG